MAPLFEHYGIRLWTPEAGGRVDFSAEGPGHGRSVGSRVTPKQQHASRREAATANDGDLCASHLTIAALAA
jgi:hypothetical protein